MIRVSLMTGGRKGGRKRAYSGAFECHVALIWIKELVVHALAVEERSVANHLER
jgi:hypothetical protein